jgi:hypothetical protein
MAAIPTTWDEGPHSKASLGKSMRSYLKINKLKAKGLGAWLKS